MGVFTTEKSLLHIALGEGGPTIWLHRAILGARSDFFGSMLGSCAAMSEVVIVFVALDLCRMWPRIQNYTIKYVSRLCCGQAESDTPAAYARRS